MTDQFRFRFRFGALCPVWLWLSSFFFFLIWSSFPVPTSALNDTDKDNDKNKEKEIKIEPLVGYFIISGIVSLIAGVLLASISYYGFVLHTPGPKLIRVWCVVFAVFDIVRKKPELAGGVAFGIMLGLDFRGEPWRYGLAHPVLLVGLAFELGSGVWRLVLAWNKWEKMRLLWILPVVPSLLSPFTYLSLPPTWELLYIIRQDCRIQVSVRSGIVILNH